MADLPTRPDLGQLRNQAKALLQEAKNGDGGAASLIAAGTPVDATDTAFGRHPLRIAAGNGRAHSVRRLLAHGADRYRLRSATLAVRFVVSGPRERHEFNGCERVDWWALPDAWSVPWRSSLRQVTR